MASKGYWLPAIALLGTSWVGSVKVEADQDIVAVGRPHIGDQVMAYNGFVSGNANAYVPMLSGMPSAAVMTQRSTSRTSIPATRPM